MSVKNQSHSAFAWRTRFFAPNLKGASSASASIPLPLKLLFLLFVSMPIIDSLNGILIRGSEEGGMSLGILYRGIIILVCALLLLSRKMDKATLAVFVGVLLCIVIPQLFNLVTSSLGSLALKLLLPILCIETFRTAVRSEPSLESWPERLITIWSFMFPIVYLVPYVLGIGYYTYPAEQTGYKAFFDAQNTLACILVILYLFAMRDLTLRITPLNLLRWALLLSCVLLTGLKSCYILIALVTLYYLLKRGFASGLKKVSILMAILVACGFGLFLFSEEIGAIVNRWLYHSSRNDSIDFFTSGRLERISPVISYLQANVAPWWPLIGSGIAYSGGIPSGYAFIEMDILDVLFQFGIVGVVYVAIYYASLPFRVKRPNRTFLLAFLIAIVMSCLAGHVIESGLGGMVLAVVCWGLPIEDARKQNPDPLCNNAPPSRHALLHR